MNYKVGIVSLGCAKNQVDAEMLLYTLKNRGFIIVNDPADADAVIVNTCGFIESAKQESINEIIELGKLKDEGKIKARWNSAPTTPPTPPTRPPTTIHFSSAAA